MLQVSMVHAGADGPLARELGSYVERNCRAEIDYHAVTKDQPVLDAVGRALSSDVLILLVSPHSIPNRLDRAQWEPLFVDAAHEHGTHIGYVVVAECPFPKVLLRTDTFDPSHGVTECARDLKRWIFSRSEPYQNPYFVPATTQLATYPAELWPRLADEPGIASVSEAGAAQAFAADSRQDFEGVFWIGCCGASVAGIAGELGAQLGLRLAGELAANLESIRDLCNRYRCLIVLEHATNEVANELGPVGRTSILLVEPRVRPAPSLTTTHDHLRTLSTWTVQAKPVPQSGEIRRTLEWLIGDHQDWTLACQFARSAVAYYKFRQRFAEAFELIEMILPESVQRHDRSVAAEFGKERAWILESWGHRAEIVHPIDIEQDRATQLSFW